MTQQDAVFHYSFRIINHVFNNYAYNTNKLYMLASSLFIEAK